MTELNVGVIGVGEMGRRHAENLSRAVPHARLVAVADVDGKRAQTVASELGAGAWYDTAAALVSHPSLHAVVIASPPKYHLEAIRTAAAAGKHVFCEKPLALTLAEADAALEAVSRAGVVLQVGHMRRYDPPYVEAKKRIDAGEIGQVVVFKSIGRDQESTPGGACQIEANGTLFHDSTTHDFDLARWLTGDEVVEVHAFGAALAIPELKPLGGFDAGVVNLQFASGAIGNIESFMDAKYGYDIRTEVVGTKGTVAIGHLRQTPLVLMTRSGSTHDLISHWLVRFAEAYLLEMRDFVQNVLAGRPARVTGGDGRHSLAVAVAAVESFRERRPVRVEGAVRSHA
jgi:scyllo-inositol 2-dehydrogenase (NAD+)